MSAEVMTKKRAARIERRKAKIAALFKLECTPDEATHNEKEEPHKKMPRLSDEDYKSLKLKAREQTRHKKNSPCFRLMELGQDASLNVAKGSRVPILASDIQALILQAVTGSFSCSQPYEWCSFGKWSFLTQTLVLVIEGVSVEDFEKNEDSFLATSSIFDNRVEMNNPRSDGISLVSEFAYVPINAEMKKRVLAGYPSLQTACADGYIYGVDLTPLQQDTDKNTDLPLKDDKVNLLTKATASDEKTREDEVTRNDHRINCVEDNVRETFSTSNEHGNKEGIRQKNENLAINQSNDSERNSITSPDLQKPALVANYGCSRLDLMLSAFQLIREGYPLPGYEEYSKFSFTKDEYHPVSDSSPMFSVDCEWCVCVDGSYGLARVAVVDENLKTLYHTLVKPHLEIADYLTIYSGINEELLRDVTKSLLDVQEDLRNLLPPDAIIVGQSVHSDLKVLKMIHPYIIDTSVIFNVTGTRYIKSKLKLLSALFCGRTIQESTDGHDPTEDAVAAMELVLLKLKMGMEFGDVVLSGGTNWRLPGISSEENMSTSLKFTGQEKETDAGIPIYMKLFTFIQSHNKSATLITTQSAIQKTYGPGLTKLKKEVIKYSRKDESLAGPVQTFSVDDFQQAVQKAIETRLNNAFTLVHTSFDEEDCKCKEKLKEVDRSVAQIYDGLSLNGMMILVFGGKSDPSQNGACLVRIKKFQQT